MPWESPYRGEESPLDKLSPKAKEYISRGTMLVVGTAFAYGSLRGIGGLYTTFGVPTTQPLFLNSSLSHHTTVNWFPWMPWMTVVGMGLLAGTLIVASVLPVSTMQSLFERWNRPPVTGDRGLDGADAGLMRFWLPWWLRRWWR